METHQYLNQIRPFPAELAGEQSPGSLTAKQEERYIHAFNLAAATQS